MIDIIKVEKAPHSRSGCVSCHQVIEKSTTRAVLSGSYFGHPSPKYACPVCALKMIEADIEALKKIKRELQGSFVADMQISILPDLERNSSDAYEDYKNSEINSLKKK